MLTGKCRNQFKEYLYMYMRDKGLKEYRFIKLFEKLPLSMQFGVYQDFADSIGYQIEISVVPIENAKYRNVFEFTIYHENNHIRWSKLEHETRNEAQRAALKEFVKLIN